MAKHIDRTLYECFHPKKGKAYLYKIAVNAERVRQ